MLSFDESDSDFIKTCINLTWWERIGLILRHASLLDQLTEVCTAVRDIWPTNNFVRSGRAAWVQSPVNNNRLLSIAANAGWHRKYNPACWIKQYTCSTNCTKTVSEMPTVGLCRESALKAKSSTFLFLSSIRQNRANYNNYTIIYPWFLIRGGVRGLRFVAYFRSWVFWDVWQWREGGWVKMAVLRASIVTWFLHFLNSLHMCEWQNCRFWRTGDIVAIIVLSVLAFFKPFRSRSVFSRLHKFTSVPVPFLTACFISGPFPFGSVSWNWKSVLFCYYSVLNPFRSL